MVLEANSIRVFVALGSNLGDRKAHLNDGVGELLVQLQAIEKSHGRVKTETRWTARPLDLDILLFGEQTIDESDLRIPHIGIAHRSFVLWPLHELQDDLYVPDLGLVSDLKKDCQKFGIKPYIGGAK